MTEIYVGCSLTHATEEFKQGINDLKDILRKEHTIIDFLGIGGGTPEEIYAHDMGAVKQCDLFVAECSYPSIGLGIEIGKAISLDKPVLAVAKTDAQVSSLVRGVTHPKFSFQQYEETEEIVEYIRAKIAEAEHD